MPAWRGKGASPLRICFKLLLSPDIHSHMSEVCRTMGTLTRIPYICLLLGLLARPVQGLEIMDPEEVEYIRLRVRVVQGGSVTLECGSTTPNIFIWGFTQPGTQSNHALAYNYGQGPKLQPLASSLGLVSVPPNSTSLLIEQISQRAEGTYTCQALYDAEEGAKITFYYTHVEVEEE